MKLRDVMLMFIHTGMSEEVLNFRRTPWTRKGIAEHCSELASRAAPPLEEAAKQYPEKFSSDSFYQKLKELGRAASYPPHKSPEDHAKEFVQHLLNDLPPPRVEKYEIHCTVSWRNGKNRIQETHPVADPKFQPWLESQESTMTARMRGFFRWEKSYSVRKCSTNEWIADANSLDLATEIVEILNSKR